MTSASTTPHDEPQARGKGATRALARHAAVLRFEALPAELVELLKQCVLDTLGVGLDGGGESYLARIFGRRNYLVINRLESLPEKLPMLYLRLTQ